MRRDLSMGAAIGGFFLVAMPAVDMLLGAASPRPVQALVAFFGLALMSFAAATREA
jgi:hypothetical protein